MGSYSIDQFSRITGISKLVLRQWENRYRYLIPERTETNIRVYNDELLVRAISTTFLMRNGYKISRIAELNDEELGKKIDELMEGTEVNNPETLLIRDFLKAAISFDKVLFNRTYKKGIKQYGLITLYSKVLLPALTQLGLLWLGNTIIPSQEHFISELIKQKIYAEIDKTDFKRSVKKENWLLFLPEDELHSIALLFSKFLLLKNGYNVIYLGENLPAASLPHPGEPVKIDKVLTFCISNESVSQLPNLVDVLTNRFPAKDCYIVTAEQHFKNTNSQHIHFIKTMEEFLMIL